MRELFADDSGRFEAFSLGLGDLFLDYSKNRITAETIMLLLALAQECDVEGWRRRLFSGDEVNTTEGRRALHVALRNPGNGALLTGGEDVMAAVKAARDSIRKVADDINSGAWTGTKGEPFKAVVIIGIGGSHLGPAMVIEALAAYRRPGPELHFVSNIDGVRITRTLECLDPKTTLFIVASKTFTTEETLTNARTARAWLTKALGEAAVASHFFAVTANSDAAAEFGIAANNTLELWDWVGGRFSLWSAVGLPIAIAFGMDRFEDLLAGAHDMDRHFADAPPEANMPVILALIGLWNIDFLGARALAVLPYDDGLRQLPAYLQQLEMESNGKSVTLDGGPVEAGTAPVIFGAAGTTGQHAFYQALHQGTGLIACDFIAPMQSHHPTGDHHQRLLANFLAQSEALMRGRTEDGAKRTMKVQGVTGGEVKSQLPHRVFEGNRPSNAILLGQVDPFTLGQLIALYEHKVFVQGVIWGINPFDQWGVELGKELAAGILGELEMGAPVKDHDSSTRGLIGRIKAKGAKTKAKTS